MIIMIPKYPDESAEEYERRKVQMMLALDRHLIGLSIEEHMPDGASRRVDPMTARILVWPSRKA